MEPATEQSYQQLSNARLELNTGQDERDVFANYSTPKIPQTPNQWFCQHFPKQTKIYGSPFIELKEVTVEGFTKTSPLAPNIDFLAAVLGGDERLGHKVVYFEPEMDFYFYDPADKIFKPTSQEKLQNLLRALLIRCAQEMPRDVHLLNLFHEFRSDKITRAVVHRAKSILAADHTFFSPTSPHQRIKGPELFERLMRVLVETMLERSEGACLTVSQAYRIFCKLSQQQQLGQLKRSMFKAAMCDLVRDVHGLGLRRDVPDSRNKQQEAWKGLKLVDVEVLTS